MSDSTCEQGNLKSPAFNTEVQGLEKLGYKQEMKRSRGLLHVLFMTLAITAVPYGLSAPIATALIGGGPATILWGWVLVSIFTQFLALSLAEICSVYPTSAGAYYWCYRLGSPKYRLVLSWINGWLYTVGVWMISLSVTFGTAQLIVAGAAIFHPEWVATPWETYLIFVAVMIFTSTVIMYLNKILPTIDICAAFWTVLGIIVILIGFSVKAAAGRRSASFALGHFDASAAGWTPGWAFFIGLLPVRFPASILLALTDKLNVDHHPQPGESFTYSAIGTITSMAEEVRRPAIQVPQGMVYSVPISLINGLVFLLPITFTLPDIKTLLAVSSGQPIGVMCTLIMGSKSGGFGMWFIVFGVGMFCSISICCAASRVTWSFARDKAIPFHHIFSRISGDASDASAVPFNAHLLSTVIQLLLSLIYLGSSSAFNSFIGVSVICLGASYAMPIAILLFGKEGRKEMRGAPYSLGRWGWWINVIALLWVSFEIVLFSMPAVIPVTQVTMNYASVVFVGFAVISAVWYIINGRYHYAGPPTPINATDSLSVNKSSL